ncbi:MULTISPECIES: lipopolysaccharide biosynthesis protein [Mesoflavibacter]|uniref:Polysaccharide biosynthesis protein C-terminal domain-containing protein n=1 Tax=Mesoflavibacter profundi TaxID=2708110 RepID=A0ABT4S1H0_9FLAO|nr:MULTISPECIES: hypothetical protein [Mesoflavibacter]MDA0177914.1 hypothetical protein [Mesoflavibacter profundi]QIJ88874.1 hypothetical protein C7H62_1065 [Mesoflavibacter sp. HG96]QIJ91602.1 hypothetical protein C7H56_1065 [Mesoflavibacter sp. HG37]
MSSNYKQLLNFALKNSGSLFLLKLIGIALNYVVLIFILEVYYFEGNGEFAKFVALSRGIKVFVVFGLDYLIVKQVASNLTLDNNQDFKLFVAFFINTVLFAFGFLVVNQFLELNSVLLGGVIVLAFWRFIGHYFRGQNNMVIYGFFEFVVFQVTVLLSLLICNFLNKNLDFLTVIVGINIVFSFLVSIYVVKRFFKTINRKEVINILIQTFKTIITIYKKSIHFVFTNSINIFSVTIMYVIIESQYTTEVLGIYDTILKMSLVVTLPLIATNGRVLTVAAKYYNNNQITDLTKYLKTNTKVLFISSTAIFLGLILFFYLFAEFYKPELHNYWWLFLSLIFAQLVNNYAGPVGIVLQATGHEKDFNKITLITALYLTISTYIFTNYFSITVVGVNTIIYLVLLNSLALKVQLKKLKINPF